MSQEIELVNSPIEKIRCEHCGKPNLSYQIYAPKEPVKHAINFICAFCDKLSKTHAFEGRMFLGPISKEESRMYTVMVDCEENNGVTTWKMSCPNANK